MTQCFAQKDANLLFLSIMQGPISIVETLWKPQRFKIDTICHKGNVCREVGCAL